MASRYPTIKVVDYCFHPVHIVDDDKDIIVPCGKCDGCLLHKSNEWSMRCGMEIEDSPATIFGSLTYTNKYLPKLFQFSKSYLEPVGNVFPSGEPMSYPCDLIMNSEIVWSSDHPFNVRFNGVRDVPREDSIVFDGWFYSSLPLVHWPNDSQPVIAYASKRDIQLWLKLLRRDLDLNLICKDDRVKKNGLFRYFIISEIGPTTHRPHYHFLLFCQSREVAEYLLAGSLYKNWQMCDEDRFTPYCHLCDSGARGYVTQYLTCFSDLPKVYKEVKDIRPFRLASKSPGIGFIGFDKKKIFEDVSQGVIEYTRPLPRLESTSLLDYPSGYLSQIFPKCYGFAKMADRGRCAIYGYLFRQVRECGHSSALLSKRLCQIMRAQDYLATSACFRFCCEYVNSPDYYYYLLDTYYYKLEMKHLKSFYESQENVDFKEHSDLIFEYYPNLEVLACDAESMDRYSNILALHYALDSLGYDVDFLIGNRSFFLKVRENIKMRNNFYRNEVKDICDNMVKVAKHNEMLGNAPTNV